MTSIAPGIGTLKIPGTLLLRRYIGSNIGTVRLTGTAGAYVHRTTFTASGQMRIVDGGPGLSVTTKAGRDGTFRDFAIFDGVDPAIAKITSVVSPAASTDWIRYSLGVLPPEDHYDRAGNEVWSKAARAAVGLQVSSSASGAVLTATGVQAEKAEPDQTIPSAFKPARQAAVRVKPTRLNYATNPNFLNDTISGWTADSDVALELDDVKAWRGPNSLKITVPADFDGGTDTVTNLVTNPRGIATSGTVEILRNLCTNPAGEVDLTGWGQYSTRDTTLKETGQASVKQYAALNGYLQALLIPSPALEFGKTYTCLARVYVAPGDKRVRLARSEGGPVTFGEYSTVTGGWTTLRLTAPTFRSYNAGSYLGFMLQQEAGASGYVWVDRVLIVEGTADDIFDGSTVSDDPDYTFSWVGTPHLSQSVMTGHKPTGVTASGGSVAYQRSTDEQSVAVRPAASGASGLSIPVTGLAVDNLNTVRLTLLADSETYLNVASTAIDAAPKTVRVLPSGATEVTIKGDGKTSSGSITVQSQAGGPTFRVTDMMVLDRSYSGPYFDGDTPDEGEIEYAWTGAANASTSTRTEPVQDQSARYTVDNLKVGETYTASVRLRVADTLTNAHIRIDGVEPLEAVSANEGENDEVTLGANPEFVVVWCSWVATNSSHVVEVYVRQSEKAVPGDDVVINLGGVLIEQGSRPGLYFDGSFPGPDYMWESGSVEGIGRTYYYEDFTKRSILLKDTLEKNTPVGLAPPEIIYATLPRS